MAIGPDLKLVRSLLRSSLESENVAARYISFVRSQLDTVTLRKATWQILVAVSHLQLAFTYFTADLVTVLRNAMGATARSMASHQHQIANIVRVQIPQVHNYASVRVDKAVVQLRVYARTQATHAYDRAHAEVVSLRQYLLSVVSKSVSLLQTAINDAVARADRQFAAVQALAQQLFRQAEADAQAAANAAEQHAVQRARVAVDQNASAPWRAQWAEITAGVTAVLTQLAGDHPDLARQLKLIVAVEPATLTEVEAAAAAAVPPMLTALQECVIPDCQDLNQLRASLHNLADIAMFAALLAWLVQMVTDPRRWAEETYAVLSPVVDVELSAVKAVLGL